jgi:hypothetical protein
LSGETEGAVGEHGVREHAPGGIDEIDDLRLPRVNQRCLAFHHAPCIFKT